MGEQLMKDLTTGGLFGKSVAHMRVTEWQKRGLPHAHILLILEDQDRTATAELVDSLVMAVDPDSFYATYRRRSPEQGGRTIQKGGKTIDNSMVIPYNPCLISPMPQPLSS